MHKLRSHGFPDGPLEIGIGAFDDCRALEAVNLPASLRIAFRHYRRATFTIEANIDDVSIEYVGWLGRSPLENCRAGTWAKG
jgi:hypothetical protein